MTREEEEDDQQETGGGNTQSEEQLLRQVVGSVARTRHERRSRSTIWIVLAMLGLAFLGLVVSVFLFLRRGDTSTNTTTEQQQQRCQTVVDCVNVSDAFCARSSARDNATKVCCPSTVFCINETETCCDNRPVDTFCDTFDEICSSGICGTAGTCSGTLNGTQTCNKSAECDKGACARKSASSSAPFICCPTGDMTESLIIDDSTYYYDVVCTNMPAGTFCMDDSSICESRLCIGGVCVAEKREQGETCEQLSDCKSNGCAKGSASIGAPKVCCPTDRQVLLDTDWVCGDMPTGTYCNDNRFMCSSQQCIDGFCFADPAGLLSDYVQCEESSQCQSGACSRASAVISAPLMCCPDGETTYGSVEGSSTSERVCRNMRIGTVCNDIDSMCASGLCINGICAKNKLDENMACKLGSDCKTNACARPAATFNASHTCCPSGMTTNGIVRDEKGSRSAAVCSSMAVGTFCNIIDEMCESGYCINGICASTGLQDAQVCTKSSDCLSKACSLGSANTSAPTICCPKGRTTSGTIVGGSWGSVCRNMIVGTFCNDIDSMCSSGFCVNGFCAIQKLDNNATCSFGPGDCKSGACARASADYDTETTCCPSGRTVSGYVRDGTGYRSASMCTEMATGTYCREIDAMCSSRLCIGGYCVDDALDDYAPCIENSDCKNGACSLPFANITAPSICCPGGRTVSGRVVANGYSSWITVCGNMPTGTFCNDIDSMCSSGLCIVGNCAAEAMGDNMECALASDCKSGACGRTVADTESMPICCPSGSSIIGRISEGLSYTTASVCTQMPTNTFCREIDSMCSSGLCIGGLCADEALEDNDICTNSNDCINGTCALASANASDDSICCPAGRSVSGYTTVRRWATLCARMPLGTFCRESNNMCASGLCINGICAEEKLNEDEACLLSSDCQNGACYLTEANSSAPLICCPGGESVYGRVSVDGGYSHSARVCANRPIGTFCNDIDSMCTSGHCVNEICQMERLQDLLPCISNSDCGNNTCSLAAARVAAGSLCCPNGDTIYGVIDGTTSRRTLCASMPIGTYCRRLHTMCESGSCINGICAEPLEEYSLCVDPGYCLNGACARGYADFDAPQICCPGGETTFAEVLYGGAGVETTFAEVCAGLKSGTFCLDTDAMCASGSCVDTNCTVLE